MASMHLISTHSTLQFDDEDIKFIIILHTNLKVYFKHVELGSTLRIYAMKIVENN